MAADRVVVTGGAGFIGSAVARMLCDEGYAVTVIDDLRFGYRELVDPRCELVECSLEDTAPLEESLAGSRFVMHFAASSTIAGSLARPSEYIENNVVNGVRLLEAMRAASCDRLVFSSSAAVYGEPARVPVQEDDPKRPLQVYGASKLAFEAVLSGYFHAFGIHSTSLRYFNAYGPGDLQQPVTRAVPRWIQAALTGKPLKMYWAGQQYRDYVFVEDIARAHLAAMTLDGNNYFNIGSGDGVLMRNLALTLKEVVGEDVRLDDAGRREGDPMRLVADTTRFNATTGWTPEVDLYRGLARTVAFYRDTRSIWERYLDG